MRVAIVGVSHFHAHYFIEEFMRRPGDELVGISDPIAHFGEEWGRKIGIPAHTDYRLMCEQARPELVFVFGRPDELAGTAEYLIASGIPSVIEKPAGINIAEIRRVKQHADDIGTFTTVPFALRYGLLARKVKELSGDTPLTYASIRVLSDLPSRYVDWGLEWNLDPRQCGGGSTLNIGSQYFDLIRHLSPTAVWRTVGATMSNMQSGTGVEDYSAVLLESDGRRAVVETGYLIPNGREVAISICAADRVFRLTSAGKVSVRERSGRQEEWDSPLTQNGWYPQFIDDTVYRVASGMPPAVTMDDMLEAALLTEAAYRLTPFDECMKAE